LAEGTKASKALGGKLGETPGKKAAEKPIKPAAQWAGEEEDAGDAVHGDDEHEDGEGEEPEPQAVDLRAGRDPSPLL